jgi:hypothetical protein
MWCATVLASAPSNVARYGVRVSTDKAYFTTVALTSSPQGPVSPRVLTQRAW